MNNNINNTDWSQAVKKSLQGAEKPSAPNPALWERINNTLDATTPAPAVIAPRRKPIVWRVAASVAAVAAILALLFINHDSYISINNSVTLAQIQEEIPTSPITSVTETEPTVQLIAETTPISQPIGIAIEPTIKEKVKEIKKVKEPQINNPQPSEKKTTIKKQASVAEPEEQPTAPQEIILNTPSPRKRANKLSITYAGGIGENKLYAANRSRESVINDAMATYNDPAHVSFEDIYNSSNITHHQPFGAGLRIAHDLSNKFTLNSGVNYTLLLSDIGLVDNDNLSTQQIHFIGVPVHVNYEFLQLNDFTLYAGAGATVEYCLFAKVGSEIINERNWHYSADINLGVEYTLNHWIGLYFEPSLSHYFTETTLRSIRNESPTTFNLRIGLSFKL